MNAETLILGLSSEALISMFAEKKNQNKNNEFKS